MSIFDTFRRPKPAQPPTTDPDVPVEPLSPRAKEIVEVFERMLIDASMKLGTAVYEFAAELNRFQTADHSVKMLIARNFLADIRMRESLFLQLDARADLRTAPKMNIYFAGSIEGGILLCADLLKTMTEQLHAMDPSKPSKLNMQQSQKALQAFEIMRRQANTIVNSVLTIRESTADPLLFFETLELLRMHVSIMKEHT